MLTAALFIAANAVAQPQGWGDWEPRWRITHGLHGNARLEKAGYGMDAMLLLSRRCLGFALPPDALRFLGGATEAQVRWRVDNRKIRHGVFSVQPKHNGVDLCAADTLVKNWEKRFAKDVMGISEDAFMRDAPAMLVVEIQGDDFRSPGVVEGHFNLDSVRRMACLHRALPRNRLRACGDEPR